MSVLSGYQIRYEQARNTETGDVWTHLKTGKSLEVISRGVWNITVRHESGKVTTKQQHYLAGDYYKNEGGQP